MTEGVTDFSHFQSSFDRIADNIEKAIQGKDEVVRLSLVALIAEGHLLLEDVPGVGKTMLAKSLAKTLGCSWQRIQFTPDLLPSDVTGVNVWNKTTGAFGFKPGAVFANGYGPTEPTVTSHFFESGEPVDRSCASVPIGRTHSWCVRKPGCRAMLLSDIRPGVCGRDPRVRSR